MIVRIVPRCVSDEITRALDLALVDHQESINDREALYCQLLDIFGSTGEVPDFDVVRWDGKETT